MTPTPRAADVALVAAAQINDELTIIRSDLDGVRNIPESMAALQRIAWTVALLANWARRNGGRACAATVERMVEG